MCIKIIGSCLNKVQYSDIKELIISLKWYLICNILNKEVLNAINYKQKE